MKSTDKFMLVLVASLFLLIAGCGGGGGSSSSTTPPTPPTPPTPIDCPDGQMPNAANDACVDTVATIAAKAVAATKAAATKTDAIADENDQTTEAGLGGRDASDAAVTTYSITFERDRDGTTVKIADSTLAGDDDPKFMQAMDLGGGRTMHTRTMEAESDGDVVEETVIVTTDIEAPKGVAFAMWQAPPSEADRTPQELDTNIDTTNDPQTGDPTLEALALTAVGSGGANLPKVMSSAFAANTAAVLTFNGDTTSDDDDEAFKTAGTYNGAMGMYMCNGGDTPCTVTLNAMGMLSEMGAGWVFIPDEDATSDQPDYDHLHYGVWLKKTTDEDGVVEYNAVETFAGSSVTATGDFGGTDAVEGSATYEGGATGVYVHQVHNPAGNIDSATSGHFTADVMLTANFGGDSVAVDDKNRISGTINNFMLSGHDTGPSWSVSLEESAIDTGAGTVDGSDKAKGGGADGNYSATFHGPVAAVDGVVPQPHTVVGEFNAFFSNGSVAGAFGARKQAE